MATEVALPLNEEGIARAELWGRQLAEQNLRCLFSSDELTSRETAEKVAMASGLRVRTVAGVEEVSLGLWEGLTEEAIRTRFPKVYKRWRQDPASVCPPDGEDLGQAQERIGRSLRRAARKAKGAPFGVVLGPIACAVARCELENAALSSMHDLLTTDPVWYDAALS